MWRFSIIIGGILIIKNNREIYFLDEAYNKDLEKFYSSHLIKWEIIKKYLNEGYKIFNLGSIKRIKTIKPTTNTNNKNIDSDILSNLILSMISITP